MRGRISADIKEEILDRTDLVALIGEHTTLKRSGNNYMGLCPFPSHKDKDPSFSVNPDKGFYYCFGCQESGNAITFVQKMQGLTFVEALETLARRSGVVIPQTDTVQERLRESLLEVLEAATRYYQEQLRSPAGKEAREILANRGVDEATIEKFRIGFAPPDWENLRPYLLRKGAREHDLVRAGLVVKRDSDNGAYDRLRNRIVFPIANRSAKVIAFGGRKIKPEDEPKYLNTPETDLFKKGATLYAFSQARQKLHELEEVILVEGYMDAIALHQHGFENTVATLGTAMTPIHWRLLERFTKRIYLLFDGDAAGRKAAYRGMDILLAEDVSPRIAVLDEGTDPDTFIRQRGTEAFREVLNRAEEGVDFRISDILAGRGKLEGEDIVEGARRILPVLHAVRNRIDRTRWIRRTAERLGLREEDLFAELARFSRENGRSVDLLSSREEGISDPAVKAKQGLIALLLSGKPVHTLARQLLEEAPEKDRHDELIEHLVLLCEDGTPVTTGKLERSLSPEALKTLAEIANSPEPIPEKYQNAARDYVQTIRHSHIAALDNQEDPGFEDLARIQELHRKRIQMRLGQAWTE